MRICCTADLHGFLPRIPPCDLLLIAGDVCPVHHHGLDYQCWWLKHTFAGWLSQQPCRKAIMVFGNHDFIGEKPELIPALPCEILTDQLTEWEGLRIYGLPWQKPFFDWAFNLAEPMLGQKYAAIPKCDIIVSHGPPLGYGDYSPYGKEHCGSLAFKDKIMEMRPQLVVFGHIHEGYGLYSNGQTIIANVSHVTGKYHPGNPPMVFELKMKLALVDP